MAFSRSSGSHVWLEGAYVVVFTACVENAMPTCNEVSNAPKRSLIDIMRK